jgi:signal transduction histidine kinase
MSGKTARPPARGELERLRTENEQLRERVERAEDTLRALSAGEVDAVVLADRERVLTLEQPDLPYRLAVEQMTHPAVTLTESGTIIYANRRFAELLGALQSELAGKALAAFANPSSRGTLEGLLRDVRNDAGPTRADITLEGMAGTPLPRCLGATMLREGAFGCCLVVTDLTMERHYDELRRTQEALRTSEQQLREADRRKDEFVATLAHELRNPLAPIRNAVKVLQTKGPDQSALKWGRDIIDRQVQVMARLLEDLLDVSRVSRNRLVLRKELVDFGAVINAALETSRPAIENGRHKLVLDLPPQPVRLLADPVRLAQVFDMLMKIGY